MKTIEELSLKLKKEKSVAIFCHIRPDGDTLGSALALFHALNNLGIKAKVFCDDTVPSRFFFLKSASLVESSLSGEFSAMLAIDCADVARLGDFAEQFLKHKNTYSLDHHVSNTRYAKENLVIDNASNCENALSLIESLGAEITVEMANLLAMGMMTDTGNFKHKNVRPNTLYSVAKLMEKGADLNTINYNMFSKQSKNRAKLFGLTMSKIRYFLDGRLAVASVLEKDIVESKAKRDETEGFIDFVTGIEGVEVSACILEMEKNKYKVSFRSKATDVNAVANTFGGGGHILASGCQIQGEYEEVVDKICFAVSRHIID